MDSRPQKFKIRTAYNDIRVYRHRERLELRSHDNALQSVIDLRSPERLQLSNLEHLMASLLFIPEPERILVLGTAAGSLLHYLRHYLPLASITTIDIDDLLVDRMLQMQVLPAADDRLAYVHADAAEYVVNCDRQFDLILVDVFHGARSPAWLLQNDTIDAIHRVCGERGAVAYNLLVASDHEYRLFYRRLSRAYDDLTLCLPVQNFENRVVCAVRHRAPVIDMNDHLDRAGALSERFGVDFLRLLSVIYSANPMGVGLL